MVGVGTDFVARAGGVSNFRGFGKDIPGCDGTRNSDAYYIALVTDNTVYIIGGLYK
jgi:hypothetical protein